MRVDSDMTSSSVEDPSELRACHSAFEVGSVSLEVPALRDRHRSSSFDANALRRNDSCTDHLAVPEYSVEGSTSESENDFAMTSASGRRKGTFKLRVPSSWQRRRSLEIPRRCLHCVYLESLASTRQPSVEDAVSEKDVELFDFDVASTSSDASTSSLASEGVTSLTGASIDRACSVERQQVIDQASARSVAPRRLVRQSEAIAPSDILDSPEASSQAERNESSTNASSDALATDDVTVVTLHVPTVAKPRSSSVDASCLLRQRHVVEDEDERSSRSDHALRVPTQVRATSVEVVLPTDDTHGMYRAITQSPSKTFVHMTCTCTSSRAWLAHVVRSL